jgi:hypothetical protein
MSALTTPTNSNKRERKRKETKKKETPTSDRKPKKGKEQDHLKKTSLGPLRQGQRLDTSETKRCSSKECTPPNKNSKTTKSSPLHMQAPPKLMQPPGRMHANHLMKQGSCINSALAGQTGHPHQLDRWTRSPSTWELHRSDRCPSPVRPMPLGKLPELKNSSKPLGNLLNACNKPFQAQTSPPC